MIFCMRIVVSIFDPMLRALSTLKNRPKQSRHIQPLITSAMLCCHFLFFRLFESPINHKARHYVHGDAQYKEKDLILRIIGKGFDVLCYAFRVFYGFYSSGADLGDSFLLFLTRDHIDFPERGDGTRRRTRGYA